MATGLFDMVTPQQAQQAYLDQFTTSPQQMGQQGLLQQVVSQMGNAGAGIGAGVGRLFGGMSPQEAEAQRVQGIMSGVDMTSSEGLLSAAKRFSQVGDVARAQALVGQADKVQQMEQAQAEQARKLAAEEATAKNKARATSMLSNKLGISEEEAMFIIDSDPKAAVEMLNPKADIIQSEVDGKVVLIDKNTQRIVATLGAAPQRGTKVDVNLPPTPADIGKNVDAFRDSTESERSILKSAEQAKSSINLALRSKNASAWEAARTNLARAAGESKLSNADIERMGVSPAIVQGLTDWLSKKVTSIPDERTMKDLYTLASLLENTNKARINEVAKTYRGAAPNYNQRELDLFFPMFEMDETNKTPQTKSWNDIPN